MSKSYYTYILPGKAHLLLEKINESGVRWHGGKREKPVDFNPYSSKINLNFFGGLTLTNGIPKSDAKLLTWPEFIDLCHKVGKYLKAAEAVNAVDDMVAEVEQSDYSIRLVVRGPGIAWQTNSYWDRLP